MKELVLKGASVILGEKKWDVVDYAKKKYSVALQINTNVIEAWQSINSKRKKKIYNQLLRACCRCLIGNKLSLKIKILIKKSLKKH